jgi:rRNA maturation endonuclease Nob1
MVFCINCGEKLKIEQAFCPSCGSKANNITKSENSEIHSQNEHQPLSQPEFSENTLPES